MDTQQKEVKEVEFIKTFVDSEGVRYSLIRDGLQYGVTMYDTKEDIYYLNQRFDFLPHAEQVYSNFMDKVKA